MNEQDTGQSYLLSVNYGVMGFTSVYAYAALRRLMGDELDNGKQVIKASNSSL